MKGGAKRKSRPKRDTKPSAGDESDAATEPDPQPKSRGKAKAKPKPKAKGGAAAK